MKGLIKFGLLWCLPIVALASVETVISDCFLKQQQLQNKHYVCTFSPANKKVNFLELNGTMDEAALYHGRFLSSEIRQGLLTGIKERKQQVLSNMDPSQQKKFLKISNCLQRQYRSSLSEEFLATVAALTRGINDASTLAPVSEAEVLEANLMVEMSIYFDALSYWLDYEPAKAKINLFRMCGLELIDNPLTDIFKWVRNLGSVFKMGCTGIAAPSSYTSDGSLIFGRNFDTGLLGSFEKYPTLILHRPPKGNAYVGMAAAGITYPGGISGFNEKGLVVSLHELQTFEPSVYYVADVDSALVGRGEVTPFLVNRILKEADSIDQALELAKFYRGFGAWTIFIADQKTNEVASIEIVGARVQLSRRVKGQGLAQSNHFFAPEMAELAFTQGLNKHLETRARYHLITQKLEEEQGNIDVQWFINTLAGHQDFYVGPRSFGRTATKVYNSMSHVMVPGKQQFWFTLAERYPATASTFVGVQIRWQQSPFFVPIGKARAQNSEQERFPSWERSFHYYPLAYLAYEAGPKNLANIQQAIGHLNQAIDLAKRDGIVDVPYHYMMARLLIKQALLCSPSGAIDREDLFLARQHLEVIIKGSSASALHPYERGLIYLHMARAEDLAGEMRPQADDHYRLAADLLLPLTKEFPQHRGLGSLLKSFFTSPGIFKSYTRSQGLEDHLQFGTVE